MAYSTSTDYTAQNAALAKQLAAATDAATKAALQAQINANDVSRTEKIASDLTAYGKYASDSELNNAAGIMAQNQLGTGYEIQKTNLNTSYDTAKQNANNDALSRGMARSSFVGDRMANLDVQRANALTQVDASKALALQNAQTNIIDNYRTNTANTLANEKTDYSNNQMTHYQDYQAEINNVLNDGDPTNDWKADKLKGWRNEKLLAQEAAALDAARYADKQKTSGSGGSNSSSNSNTNNNNNNNNPFGNTTNANPVTSDYGNTTIGEVNNGLNGGFTPQEIIAAAKSDLASGAITQAKYNSIVDAALRPRR